MPANEKNFFSFVHYCYSLGGEAARFAQAKQPKFGLHDCEAQRDIVFCVSLRGYCKVEATLLCPGYLLLAGILHQWPSLYVSVVKKNTPITCEPYHAHHVLG